MGKKHHSREGEKVVNSVNKEKKQLLKDAADLFATCIKSVSPQEEWDFYVRLHAAMEAFQEKQNAVFSPPVPEEVERSSLIPVYKEWLQQHGVTWNHIDIHDYGRYQGLGVIATDKIKNEELLVAVPREVILTHANITKDSYLKDLIEKNELLLQMPNVCLALFLHCELYNPSSKYKPYVDILPKSFNTTLYFTPDELKYLRGSTVLSQAINHYKSIVRQFALIYKIFNGPEKNKPYVEKISASARGAFTFEAYRWCVSAVSTRQNEIPINGDTTRLTLALIPLWDMFNHKPGKMTTSYDVIIHKVESFAMSDFKEGDQVNICYGHRKNADLLVHNGFVIDFNRYEEGIPLSLGISRQDPLFNKKKLLLQRLRCAVSGEYMLAPGVGGIPTSPQLFTFLRVFHLNQDNLDSWLAKDDNELQTMTKSKILVHTEFQTMCKYLEDRIKLLISLRERACGGNIDELAADESLSLRSKLALGIQRHEKFTLTTCMKQCEETRNKLATKFKKSI